MTELQRRMIGAMNRILKKPVIDDSDILKLREIHSKLNKNGFIDNLVKVKEEKKDERLQCGIGK